MLKKKLNNEKGFTLAELLIVVAILAVLVAISVPIFTSKLSDAKLNTDKANIRAAKAAASAQYLSDTTIGDFWYDADNGKLVEATSGENTTNIAGYGKSTSTKKTIIGTLSGTAAPNGKVLKLNIGDDGTITFGWFASTDNQDSE